MHYPRIRVIAVIVAVHLSTMAAHSEQFEATITRVSAANVLEIQHDSTTELVALYGVTAPPSNSLFGQQAKAFAEQRVLGKTLPIRVVSRRQGLTYVGVELPNGRSLGHVMLRQGLVEWDSLSAPNDRGLRDLEALARQDGIGLWANEGSEATSVTDAELIIGAESGHFNRPSRSEIYPRVVESQVVPGEEGQKTLMLRGNARKEFGYEAVVEQARANAAIERLRQQQIQQENFRRQQEAALEAQSEQQRLANERARLQLELQNQQLLNEQLRRDLGGGQLVIPLTRNRP